MSVRFTLKDFVRKFLIEIALQKNHQKCVQSLGVSRLFYVQSNLAYIQSRLLIDAWRVLKSFKDFSRRLLYIGRYCFTMVSFSLACVLFCRLLKMRRKQEVICQDFCLFGDTMPNDKKGGRNNWIQAQNQLQHNVSVCHLHCTTREFQQIVFFYLWLPDCLLVKIV